MRVIEKGERDKLEYDSIISSDYQIHQKSRAHAELLEALGFKVNWKGKFDDFHIGDVITEAYNTGSCTTKESLKKEMKE